jgi:hypothetical protein
VPLNRIAVAKIDTLNCIKRSIGVCWRVSLQGQHQLPRRTAALHNRLKIGHQCSRGTPTSASEPPRAAEWAVRASPERSPCHYDDDIWKVDALGKE